MNLSILVSWILAKNPSRRSVDSCRIPLKFGVPCSAKNRNDKSKLAYVQCNWVLEFCDANLANSLVKNTAPFKTITHVLEKGIGFVWLVVIAFFLKKN